MCTFFAVHAELIDANRTSDDSSFDSFDKKYAPTGLLRAEKTILLL